MNPSLLLFYLKGWGDSLPYFGRTSFLLDALLAVPISGSSLNSQKDFGPLTMKESPFPSGIRMFHSEGGYSPSLTLELSTGTEMRLVPLILSCGRFSVCYQSWGPS